MLESGRIKPPEVTPFPAGGLNIKIAASVSGISCSPRSAPASDLRRWPGLFTFFGPDIRVSLGRSVLANMNNATERTKAQQIEPLLYTRKITANLLSISLRSVDYMIQSGKLGHRKIGTRVLVPASQGRRMAETGRPYDVTA